MYICTTISAYACNFELCESPSAAQSSEACVCVGVCVFVCVCICVHLCLSVQSASRRQESDAHVHSFVCARERIHSNTHAQSSAPMHTYRSTHKGRRRSHSAHTYGVATISRLLKIIGLFYKRALEKRRYFQKETYNSKEPTNRSHPIPRHRESHAGWRRPKDALSVRSFSSKEPYG